MKPPHEVSDMINMRLRGLTLREIAAKHGITKQGVAYLLQRDGPRDLERRAMEAQQARGPMTHRPRKRS